MLWENPIVIDFVGECNTMKTEGQIKQMDLEIELMGGKAMSNSQWLRLQGWRSALRWVLLNSNAVGKTH